jgi:putative FmdB family regulatory protein
MPTYEYACKSCGEHLEVVQSFKDDALTECPACGGNLRKVFGNIGIAFKGSGFYKNDSRATAKSGSGNGDSGKSEPAAASSSSASSSSSSSSGDSSSKSSDGSPAKTESKPAGEKKTATKAAS